MLFFLKILGVALIGFGLNLAKSISFGLVGIVVTIVFKSVFYLEMHQNNFFYF
jgi:hypothetical protein